MTQSPDDENGTQREHRFVDGPGRTFNELRTSGLLWLLNSAALHPRGYSLAFCWAEGADKAAEEPIGWRLYGPGDEPWVMPDDAYTEEMFRRVETLLREHQGVIPRRASDAVIASGET